MNTDLTFANLPNREASPQRNEQSQQRQQSQQRHRNIYDYDGEYEFLTAQHWTAPDLP